jgi:hypothetical protein
MIADDSHKDKLCAGGYMQAVRYCKVKRKETRPGNQQRKGERRMGTSL